MSFESQHVLLTGVAGFLGSNLLTKMLGDGHRVTGIDNLSRGLMRNIAAHADNPNFQFIEADITDEATFEGLSDDFDVIVHLAAFKIPRYGNAVATLTINAKGTELVLEYAKKLHVKCVLASTSDVYGMNPELPFREDGNCVLGDSKVPRWGYAVSKLFDEHLALAYMEDHGFPVVLLRFFGSYGPHQHLSWWGGPQSVFIEKILKDEVIPIHGDGSQTRTFTYVDDTVAGIYAATMMEEANGEIFNIGAHQEITIHELAKLLKEISGTPGELKVEFIPYDQISQGRKYQDVMRRVPDTSKLTRMLGITAQVPLEEGLRRTFEWQKEILSQEHA
ncbi:NAD-dependent epimerase/dehydratase family protein [Pontibacter sp. G13]|uniref:NAD-dependent epimerase/dehydratase family protein n=1 Tax=Pontibacter sp. G13 TaxID=3074898 RepID=UPI00288B74DF|nr:NAD-dependent epimerase/dehydratase family protein [Pontibacter sp. G13]WNJ19770.1 GDP-mannose 4,6-dehydratase [Pontibacter sp. G13]